MVFLQMKPSPEGNRRCCLKDLLDLSMWGSRWNLQLVLPLLWEDIFGERRRILVSELLLTWCIIFSTSWIPSKAPSYEVLNIFMQCWDNAGRFHRRNINFPVSIKTIYIYIYSYCRVSYSTLFQLLGHQLESGHSEPIKGMQHCLVSGQGALWRLDSS